MTSFLIVAILLFLVWLAFFLFSNETRQEQLIMSIVGLVLSPGILIIAATDYRAIISETASVVGIEDLIFAFSFFGVAAVIFQVLVGKHAHKLRGPRYETEHFGHWIGHLAIVFGVWAVITLLTVYVFDLTSVQAFIMGGLMVGMYIIADRHDLLMNALVSGIFMASLIFLLENIFFVRLFPLDAGSFWQFEHLSPMLLGGVPMEELIWAAVAGFAIGPLYEWLRHLKLTNKS